MLFRNARLLSFLLIATGVGLMSWYGEERLNLREWSEAEIEEAVQLELAVELHRRGPHLRPTGERFVELYATVRAEIEARLRREREGLERWIGVGALLCVLGCAHWLKRALLPRAG